MVQGMVFATLFACLIPLALAVPMLLKYNPMNLVYFCLFMTAILWMGGLSLVARTDQLNPQVCSALTVLCCSGLLCSALFCLSLYCSVQAFVH